LLIAKLRFALIEKLSLFVKARRSARVKTMLRIALKNSCRCESKVASGHAGFP
jgi:hypothetical protein